MSTARRSALSPEKARAAWRKGFAAANRLRPDATDEPTGASGGITPEMKRAAWKKGLTGNPVDA